MAVDAMLDVEEVLLLYIEALARFPPNMTPMKARGSRG